MVEFTESNPKTIKINLKFSKGWNEEEEEDEEEKEEEEDKKISCDDNFDLDDQKKIQSKEKVCEVCNKVFGSGKALGGHMRIHFQAYKKPIFKENKKKKSVAQQSIKLKKFKNSSSSNSLDQLGSDDPTCALCGKIFPSMKALFGHMRCHPEREWRGINPPSSPRLSLSTDSSDTDELVDDGDDLAGDEEFLEPVNMMEVLPKWSVTAKRKHKPARVVIDQEFREGVDHLMMFAKGTGDSSDHHPSDLSPNPPKGESFEVTNSNSPGNNNKVIGLFDEDHHQPLMNELVNDEEGKGFSNNGVIGNNVLMKSGGTCNAVQSDDRLKNCENSLIGKEGLIIKSKKERKKMRLIRDLDQIQDNGPPLIIHHTPPPPPQVMASPPALVTATATPEKYKCSTCGKCFRTHQALGGHKSSHNKFRMFIHNSIDDHKYYSPQSGTDTGSPAKKVKKIMKESQENDEEVGVHQHHQYLSKVCNKISHTGQTLGGPKRCHWDNNISCSEVEAQSISMKVVSHTTGRVLDFDLNELPPVEEDHNDEEAQHHTGGSHFASSSQLLNK